jgi:hypothetical protein
VRGQADDRRFVVNRFDTRQELDPVGVGQLEIEQNELRRLFDDLFLKDHKRTAKFKPSLSDEEEDS